MTPDLFLALQTALNSVRQADIELRRAYLAALACEAEIATALLDLAAITDALEARLELLSPAQDLHTPAQIAVSLYDAAAQQARWN